MNLLCSVGASRYPCDAMDTVSERIRDPIRDLVWAKLHEKRLTLAGASKTIGHNHAYLQQYFNKGVPIELPEKTREALERLLELKQGQLKPLVNGKEPVNRMQIVQIPVAAQGDTIPVLGAGEGGPVGWFLWNGDIVERRARPPELRDAINGFGVYVIGHSMEPRYEPGQVVYVHPGKPPTPGCYVLVQTKPHQEGEPPCALIKRYVKRTATKLILEQLSPPKQIEIPAGDVVSVYRIVGTGE